MTQFRDTLQDAPRDENGRISSPWCNDMLEIYPEWGSGRGESYLWNANGTCITLEYPTGQTEPLDAQLQAWNAKLDSQDPSMPLFNGDPDQWAAFRDEGERLAEAVYRRFDGQKIVTYAGNRGPICHHRIVPPVR